MLIKPLLVAWLALLITSRVSSAQTEVILFPVTNTWKYEQTANLDGVTWQKPDFNELAWPSGIGLLYVEDNSAVKPRNTSLVIGRSTYYFRTHFQFTNAISGVSLVFSNLVDDGAVFYLNGTEVQRLRMPAPPAGILYGTLATAAAEATAYERFQLSNQAYTHLVIGDNVLAVEVHQSVAGSSDIVFGTALSALVYTGAMAFVTHPTNVSVADGGPVALIANAIANPDPSYQWYRDGLAIEGATNRNYYLPAAFPSHAGTYFVRASNSTETLVSSNAVLTVTDDTNAPVPLFAMWLTDGTRILIPFDETVEINTAADISHYSVNPVAGTGTVQVLAVTVTNGTNVIITTTPRTVRANYIVNIEGVRDVSSRSNSVSMSMALRTIVDIASIGAESVWMFNDSGKQPPSNWVSLDFDETGWSEGAPLFYGGANGQTTPEPVRTTLALTNVEGSERVLTHYFRYHFDFPGENSTSEFRLRHIVDDGAIFYLNGQEFYSVRMPPTRPVYATNIASSTVVNPLYEPPISQSAISITVTNLIAGENVLAVEVHQRLSGNSDAAFGANIETTVEFFSPALRLFVPSTLDETVGTVTHGGFVVLDVPTATNITVQLASSQSNLIGVPPQVIIPAGASNANFDITVTNDTLLNSDRIVTIVAHSAGFSTSRERITVTDDEFGILNLSMPVSLREGDASNIGVISVDRAPDINALVSLTVSNAGLSIPSNVMILAGTTSSVFTVSATDDRIIEETELGSVRVSFGNWTPATVAIAVFDNEATNMLLVLQSAATEGDGVRSSAGEIRLFGVVSSNLVVNLSSSDETKLTVPASVVILAGQSNVLFNVVIVDNSLTDGTKPSIVTATAAGFQLASRSVSVADNDLHHFAFSDISSPQFQGATFPLAIDAMDVNGLRLLSFSNQVSLSASSGGQAVPSFGTNLIRFVAGRWTSNTSFAVPVSWVRLLAAFGAASSQSQPFDVDPSPLRILPIAANDVVYLARSNRLWATVGGSSPSYANNLVEIDPVVGAVISSFSLGPEPARIVKTDNEESLYVSYGTHPFVISKGTYVRQFNLTNRQFSFTIGDGTMPVYDLAPVQGNPKLVVLATRFSGGSSGEIRVFDNGVARPTAISVIQNPWLSRIESAETPNLLYGVQNGAFSQLRIGDDGITFQSYAGPIFENDAFKVSGGLVYSTLGKIVDPQAGTLVGNYLDSGGNAIEVEPRLQRTYLISGGGTAPYSHSIRAYDERSRAGAGVLNLSGVQGVASRLVRFGTNGLAFTTGAKLALVESDVLIPSTNLADLTITQEVLPDGSTSGSNIICKVTVSNRGPQVAFRPLVTGRLPTGSILTSSNVTEGAVQIQNGLLNWRLGELPVGGVAVGVFSFVPSVHTVLTNSLTVTSRNIDINPSDNTSTAFPEFPVVDLRLSQSYVASTTQVGSNITYFLTISNSATNAAWQMVVRDQLPVGSLLEAATASHGWIIQTNGGLEWRISGLAAGDSAMAALTVSSSLAGWFNNSASVLSWSPDSVPSNNVSVLWHFMALPDAPERAYAMTLPVSDMLYDTQRQRLIVSTSTNGGFYSNSIVIIDPQSGLADATISLGGPSGKLARSDDGQFLYVSMLEAAVVRRFHLPTLTSNLQFSLGGEMIYGRWYPWFAQDIRVLPGQPNSIAVSRVRQSGPLASEWHEGVVIADEGVLRATSTPGCNCWYSLEFGASASNLVGSRYNNTVDRLVVDANGVSLAETADIGGANPQLKFANGVMYATSGRAFDPQTLQSVGRFNGVEGAATFAVDALSGHAYYLTRTNSNWILLGFDVSTFASIGSLLLTNVSGTPSNLVYCADDRFAFHTSAGQLYFVRSSNFKNADIQLSVTASNTLLFAQQEFELQWNVSSRGNDATDVVVSNNLSPFVAFLGGNASSGSIFLTNGSVLWSVAALASNAEASAVLQLRFTNSTDILVTNTTTALTTVRDPIGSNNWALLQMTSLIDNNGNGLGDSWERSNFGSLDISPLNDSDGDGFSNQQEFTDGTDPNDFSNALRILAFIVRSNTASLTFFAARNHDYAIEKSASLSGPWLEVLTLSGGGMPASLTEARSGPTVFYRIRRKF